MIRIVGDALMLPIHRHSSIDYQRRENDIKPKLFISQDEK